MLADAAWLARCTAVVMAGVGHQRLLARLGAIVLHTPPLPSRTAVIEIDRALSKKRRDFEQLRRHLSSRSGEAMWLAVSS